MPPLEQVLEIYSEQVKVVFKNFPLKRHEFAMRAAIASIAAKRQGKFWEFHDRLFYSSPLSNRKIREIARDLGLNTEQFEEDLGDRQILTEIHKDIRDGLSAGVRGIPTVFVNGRSLRNLSLEGFQTAIEKELERVWNVNGQPSPGEKPFRANSMD